MTEHNDSILGPIVKVFSVIAAWFGAIQLAQVQAVVAILSGLVVAGYAATQWYVLWRDKIRKEDGR
jgi:hypothetical protein